MKRCLLLVAVVACMVAVSAVSPQGGKRTFPPLDWANAARDTPPPVALLVELGLKDSAPRDWSGTASVAGAQILHREGYRFRAEDKLTGDAWTAHSHREIRAPKGQPAISKLLPIVPVGIVLHLDKLPKDATLSLELKSGEMAQVPIADLLTGRKHSLWNGAAAVRLISTATPVVVDKTEDDFPAAAHAPDGTLWLAYNSYTVREDSRRIEAPELTAQPETFKSFYTPGGGDQLFVRSHKQGQWSKPIAITPPGEDIARCAIAVTGSGDVLVVYSCQRQGNFDLYARHLTPDAKLGDEQRLTTNAGPDLTPAMCSASDGSAWAACQSWNDKGQAGIAILHYTDGKWGQSEVVTTATGNCWHPSLAAGPTGEVALAYDVYRNGSYDVEVLLMSDKKARPIAATAKFEARPSIVYDKDSRLWLAYEEGPENWGKDYGALDAGAGNPLYNERSVRVLCLEPDGSLKKPAAELPTSRYDPPRLPFEPLKTSRYESTPRYAFPKLGLDGAGNVWLAARHNFGTRYSSHPGAYWLTFARRLDATGWSEPIELHHSDGLLDNRPVLLPHTGGGLIVVHNTDGRFTTPEVIDNQIYISRIALPPADFTPKLVAVASPEARPPTKAVETERAAIQRMKTHRIEAAGKSYRFLRGEFHRHTEISWDGSADGALEDMFRYAIDAAGFEWIGNGDHDNGAGREYPWWLVQKFSDAYHVARAFTPMFTYERSVAYPHGHRNCMFARRGVRTLPRLAKPAGDKGVGGVHADDTKMLYRYLRELDGICAVHTSATGMGTDWRDNDPAVEPIVEIYQGDRMSYEMEGAPRAGYDPQTNKDPANVAGWYPKGFINLALQKGYKLGFQSSSDHWSTHISYFVVLAENHDRQSLLDAIKKRHCYGATDNILLDFRTGNAIMGDEIQAILPPTFALHVIGTANLAKVELLRDSEVAATFKTNGPEFRASWAAPDTGNHYYYLRAVQTDGELAWSSPIWVRSLK